MRYMNVQIRYTDVQDKDQIDQLDTKVQQCNQIYRI
jgi:hypothetical protein